MNRSETLVILGTLQTAYPSFYRGMSREQMEAAVKLWQDQFANVEYKMVEAAVRAIISTRVESYPPTIGTVNEMILNLTSPAMNEMEAWGYLRKALRNGIYGYKEEWERLPEPIKKVVSPDQIHAWATDDEFNENVVSSNFMRSFKARQESERKTQMLPADLQKMVRIAAESLKPKEQIEGPRPRAVLPQPSKPPGGSLRQRLIAVMQGANDES